MRINFLDRLKHLFAPGKSNNYRPRILHPEALTSVLTVSVIGLFAFVLVIRQLQPSGFVLGYASDINVSQVVALTNQERQAFGLAPLTYNSKLATAALNKAQDMFTNQYWAHTSPSGLDPWYFIEAVGYRYRVAGENLARDFARTPELLSAWMESPTHRANIVNDKYQEIGIAVVDGVLNGVETTLVVQMFGTPATLTPNVAAAPPQMLESDFGSEEYLPQDVNVVEIQVDDPQILSQSLLKAEDRVVLADAVSRLESLHPLAAYSPRQLIKAVFLSLILLLISTLSYDLYAIGHHQSLRLVGKNLAHILFLTAIAFIIIYYKAGFII